MHFVFKARQGEDAASKQRDNSKPTRRQLHGVSKQMNGDRRGDIFSELPHILVLVLLLFVLLLVVTKFKYVHCSQIPQWCSVYCTVTGSSRVAIITGDTGDTGQGDGNQLERLLNQNRLQTLVTRLRMGELSAGLLEDYELVVLTNAKNVSLGQALALLEYINKGGSVLWEGDALTSYNFTEADQFLLAAENRSKPGTYEAYVRLFNNTKGYGFGFVGQNLGLGFVQILQTDNASITSTGAGRFRSVKDHLMTSGIKNFEFIVPLPFAQVVEDPKLFTKIAVMNGTRKEYPLLLERKTAGRIVYTAIPLEYIDSKTLLLNVFDYLVTC